MKNVSLLIYTHCAPGRADVRPVLTGTQVPNPRFPFLTSHPKALLVPLSPCPMRTALQNVNVGLLRPQRRICCRVHPTPAWWLLSYSGVRVAVALMEQEIHGGKLRLQKIQ